MISEAINIEIYQNPPEAKWQKIAQRPVLEAQNLQKQVQDIMKAVKIGGDEALLALTAQYDGVALETTVVPAEALKNAPDELSPALLAAIETAARNIRIFHASQKEAINRVETQPGVVCWRKSVPIQRVGLYIPGGTAPLFSSLLMLAIPAQLAGCKEIVVITPPQADGTVHPTIRAVAQVLGLTKIYAAGGAQAIAALTFGTETIPKVDKILGPGNQYVTQAKQLAQEYGVSIDMPAGPSEVLVIADDSANPGFVAADLLSQAEHGADSQVVLVSPSAKLLKAVQKELNVQLQSLSRKEIAAQALKFARFVQLNSTTQAMAFSNLYAPEHLIIATEDAPELAETVENAGSVFIGNYACESAGDYASGTNHTLPTNGYARNYSGVSLDTFMKKITFQEISKQGIKDLGPVVELLAEAEGLDAHKNAVTIRLKSLENEG